MNSSPLHDAHQDRRPEAGFVRGLGPEPKLPVERRCERWLGAPQQDTDLHRSSCLSLQRQATSCLPRQGRSHLAAPALGVCRASGCNSTVRGLPVYKKEANPSGFQRTSL